MPIGAGTSGATPRPFPRAAGPSATAGRVTRLRAARDTPASSPVSMPAKPSGLLARGKEGLRKVSDKIKEKEKPRTASTSSNSAGNTTDESLQAFLRIRPPPVELGVESSSSRPYLEPQGDRDVLMRSPIDPNRPHMTPKAPLVYSFDKVFAPPASQEQFFTQTTLPLVEKVLKGENGLLFAYGVSNSGKSYTISGGQNSTPEDRGVLPRSIDVVFNSIKGLESNIKLKCLGLAEVEVVKDDDQHPGLFSHLPPDIEGSSEDAVKLDRNYRYAVFVSYAEVYNEKIFDLLDAVLPAMSTPSSATSKLTKGSARPTTVLPRASSAWGLSGALHSSMNLAALANGGGGVFKRRALALKNDPEGSGKYVAGLNEIRVRTRDEALAIFRAGQSARQVFGTLANRESSRSHGIFTMKIVKIHNAAPNDPDSAQVSRLAVVDLAGSERTRNTGTTGDRLKEAGNINKSLMVLGQCLEVLRANQQRLATPGIPGQKKRLAMVPFRHSKLTEIFQNFFVGDGRAVMIVNVNPYDTGFDENSHVMRFSAVAREVQTTAGNKMNPPNGLRRQISTQFSALKQAVSGPMKIKVTVPVIPQIPTQPLLPAGSGKAPQAVAERESAAFEMVEEELEVVEEDEDDDESDDGKDALVDHLFEQLKELKTRLYESEMRNATIEVEVREEMAQELQDTVQRMHEEFSARLRDQVSAGEVKIDRKIDILSRMATPAVNHPAGSSRMIPGGRLTHLASTPPIDGDTTMDSENSFISATSGYAEEAVDESLVVDSETSFGRPSSDPFLVSLPPIVGDLEGSENESYSDGEATELEGEEVIERSRVSESTTDSPQVTRPGAKLPRRIREDTADSVESEDALASPVAEDDVVDEEEDDDDLTEEERTMDSIGADESLVEVSEVKDSAGTDASQDHLDAISDEEDEDVDSEEEEEEEEAEDAEEDELEDSSGSDFDADITASTASEPSPPRRMSMKRATPIKPRATPKKATGTPSKSTPGVKASAIKPAPILSPLSERLGQDVADEDELEDEVKPVVAKKKRTLGKKIVMEDEMAGHEAAVSGAEVRRAGRK